MCSPVPVYVSSWAHNLVDCPPWQSSAPGKFPWPVSPAELRTDRRLAAGRAIVSKVGSRRPAAGTVGIQWTLCGHRVTKYGHVPCPRHEVSLGSAQPSRQCASSSRDTARARDYKYLDTVYLCMCFNRFEYFKAQYYELKQIYWHSMRQINN